MFASHFATPWSGHKPFPKLYKHLVSVWVSLSRFFSRWRELYCCLSCDEQDTIQSIRMYSLLQVICTWCIHILPTLDVCMSILCCLIIIKQIAYKKKKKKADNVFLYCVLTFSILAAFHVEKHKMLFYWFIKWDEVGFFFFFVILLFCVSADDQKEVLI